MSSDHDVADVFMADGPEHLDTVLEDVRLNHLLEVDGFGTVTGNDEPCVGVVLYNSWDCRGEEICAFVVEET